MSKSVRELFSVPSASKHPGKEDSVTHADSREGLLASRIISLNPWLIKYWTLFFDNRLYHLELHDADFLEGLSFFLHINNLAGPAFISLRTCQSACGEWERVSQKCILYSIFQMFYGCKENYF